MSTIEMPLERRSEEISAFLSAPRAPALDALNRPLRDLRLSVIDQCNFRCTYCMPKDVFGRDYQFLPSSSILSFDKMVEMATAFAQLGVEKIRLTGGEPLLRKDIEALVESLAMIPTLSGKDMEIALTTNGSLLANKARSLRSAGLRRVTISLDSLDDTIFQRMNGVDFPVSRVIEGIESATAAGLEPVKVNAVIERGVNECQILPIAERFRDTGVIVRFIEFMDVGGAASWSGSKVFSSEETRVRLEAAYALIPVSDTSTGATASNYRYADGKGEVGFISSMSHPFCSSCTRARVSADGQLFMCLFATQGFDLNPWLSGARPNERLVDVLRKQWSFRSNRYSETRAERRALNPIRLYPTVRMSLVGG